MVYILELLMAYPSPCRPDTPHCPYCPCCGHSQHIFVEQVNDIFRWEFCTIKAIDNCGDPVEGLAPLSQPASDTGLQFRCNLVDYQYGGTVPPGSSFYIKIFKSIAQTICPAIRLWEYYRIPRFSILRIDTWHIYNRLSLPIWRRPLTECCLHWRCWPGRRNLRNHQSRRCRSRSRSYLFATQCRGCWRGRGLRQMPENFPVILHGVQWQDQDSTVERRSRTVRHDMQATNFDCCCFRRSFRHVCQRLREGSWRRCWDLQKRPGNTDWLESVHRSLPLQNTCWVSHSLWLRSLQPTSPWHSRRSVRFAQLATVLRRLLDRGELRGFPICQSAIKMSSDTERGHKRVGKIAVFK